MHTISFSPRPVSWTWLVRFCVLTCLLVGSVLIAPPAHAQSPCQNPYRVSRGDYLLAIAQRCNVNFWELLKYNPQFFDSSRFIYRRNPNLIYAGELINLPPPQSIAGGGGQMNLAAEITYFYTPPQPNALRLGPQPKTSNTDHTLNKRVVYKLQPGQECKTGTPSDNCNVALGSSQLTELLNKPENQKPIFVLIRQSAHFFDPGQPNQYDLVAIGDAANTFFTPLGFLDNPINVPQNPPNSCARTNLVTALGDSVHDAQGTFLVETGTPYRHPFNFSGLVSFASWPQFKECYSDLEMVLALYPSTNGKSDEYWLLLFLTDPSNPGGGGINYSGSFYSPSPWWGNYCFWC